MRYFVYLLYNLKTNDMQNLFFIAQDRNADELFAMIDADHFDNPTLSKFKYWYENAQIEDIEFCEKVLDYLKPNIGLDIFAVMMVEREDSDNPTLSIIRAENEEDAYNRFATSIGHTGDSLHEGEEEGEIVIIIKEAK